MKKVISLILVIAIMLLIACSDVEADTEVNYIQDISYGYYEILIDKETGVNYILYSNNYKHADGITPRLNADGTPYVSEVE